MSIHRQRPSRSPDPARQFRIAVPRLPHRSTISRSPSRQKPVPFFRSSVVLDPCTRSAAPSEDLGAPLNQHDSIGQRFASQNRPRTRSRRPGEPEFACRGNPALQRSRPVTSQDLVGGFALADDVSSRGHAPPRPLALRNRTGHPRRRPRGENSRSRPFRFGSALQDVSGWWWRVEVGRRQRPDRSIPSATRTPNGVVPFARCSAVTRKLSAELRTFSTP